MQFLADQLGVPVERPRILETTALGAAYLAGLATGVWSSREELANLWRLERRFSPGIDSGRRETLYNGWKKAVSRTRNWED
jgi:glycerol kinase